MISDLEYQGSHRPSKRLQLDETRLLESVAIAFKGRSPVWLNFIPKLHAWLFPMVLDLSNKREWPIEEIYAGEKPCTIDSDFNEEMITCTLMVDGWQYSKIKFMLKGE